MPKHHILPRSGDVLPGEGWHGGGVASVVNYQNG